MPQTKSQNEEHGPWTPTIDVGCTSTTEALLHLWTTGADAGQIFHFLTLEVAPRLHSHLKQHLRLQKADREDCIASAFESFAPAIASRDTITNPYAYVFKIGVNEALQLLRSRKSEMVDDSVDVEDMERGSGQPPASPFYTGTLSPDEAVMLVEDAASELEVEAFWAVEVVSIALSRLSPGGRQAVTALRFHDLDLSDGNNSDFIYSSEEIAAGLGIKPGAFRTAKSRAYDRLRQLIPSIILEIGLSPPERAEAAIFPEGRAGFLAEE